MSVRRHLINVCGVPTRLLTLGGGPEDRPNRIVLVIPGNPGKKGILKSYNHHIRVEKISPNVY